MAATPSKKSSTPTKSIEFLTPSAENICLVCQKNVVSVDKVNLKKSGLPNETGKLVEQLFGIVLDELNFSCLDRNCWRQIQTLKKKFNSFKEKIENG